MRVGEESSAPYFHVRSVRQHGEVESTDAASLQSPLRVDGTELSLSGTATDTSLNEQQEATIQGIGKRKETASPTTLHATSTIVQQDFASDAKRRKLDVPSDPQSQDLASIHDKPPSKTALHDVRAAGVHSAAALFRRYSEKAPRKSTRPPMSKLFMSLQLTPENFLHLQSQAKAYMLDPLYPSRQNCVGNRGKGDNDMVKLRLFNCVREFLESGVGERFFGAQSMQLGETDAIEAARALGEEVKGDGERLVWPNDGNKIIGLVTPLMRRMVTNERQRMYAIETRKGGTERRNRDSSAGSTGLQVTPERQRTPTRTVGREVTVRLDHINIFLVLRTQEGEVRQASAIKLLEKRIVTGSPLHNASLVDYGWDEFVKEVDLLLNELRIAHPALYHDLQHGPGDVRSVKNDLQDVAAAANALHDGASSGEHVDLHAPRGNMSPSATLHAASVAGASLPRHSVKTLGEDGWQVLGDVVQWRELLQQRAHDIWADGVVNIIVEVSRVEDGAQETVVKA